MNRRSWIVIWTVLLLGICHAAAYASSKEESYRQLSSKEENEFFQQMREALGTVKTLKADFIQRRHLLLFLDTLTAEGICWFKTPDRLRWELIKPYRSILIYNKNQVAKFDLEDGNRKRRKPAAYDILREVLKEITAWMKADFARSREIYKVCVLKGDDFRVMLIPRTKEMLRHLKSIRLSIDPLSMHVKSVVIREIENDYMEIEFVNQETNIEFEDRIFDLTNPRTHNPFPSQFDSDRMRKKQRHTCDNNP